MGVFQVNIKGHAGKNTGVPWLHYRKERGNRIADGDGSGRGSGRVAEAVPASLQANGFGCAPSRVQSSSRLAGPSFLPR